MTIADKYAEKTGRLENAAADAVRIALRPYWEEAYRNAQDGDLVGKLHQAIEDMDTDLHNLALALLPSKAGQEQQALTRFLEAEEPLVEFYQLGNSLAANKSPEYILGQLTSWMLDWSVQYLRNKDATKWTEDDEKKMWRMVRWALPRREADQGKWQAFADAFGPRSWRRAARKHMEDPASRPTLGVLAHILNELPADADELFHVNNEGVPNLKAVAEIRDPRTLADEHLVKYSPSVWREVINDEAGARQDRPASSVLKWGGGIVFVIVLTALVWFGLNQFGVLGEVAETPVASETPQPEETEEPGATATPLPGETPAVTLTLDSIGAAWGCAAGNESWHKVTVTGEPNATYSIQTDSGSLPEGLAIWEVADAQLPDQNELCQPPEIPLNNASGTLDETGNAYLLISQPTSGISPLSLQAVSENTPSDPVELLLWTGDVQAQLNSVGEIPTAEAPLVFTEPISFTWEIAVTVPGEYQLVCINTAMPGNSPVVSAPLVFDAPNVFQSAECLIDSVGDWQASVYPAPYEENDPAAFIDSVENFVEVSVIEAYYEINVEQVDELGLVWGPDKTTDGNNDANVGFVLVYEVKNLGNITDTAYLNITNTNDNVRNGNGEWSYFITVLPASDFLSGSLTFSEPLVANATGIKLSLVDGNVETLPIQPVEEDGGFQIVDVEPCLPDGQCNRTYIAVWLNTFYKNSVNDVGKNATFDIEFTSWAKQSELEELAKLSVDLNTTPDEANTIKYVR